MPRVLEGGARLGPCRGAGCAWSEDTKRALTEKPNGFAEYQRQNCRECDKPTCMVSRFRLSDCSWEGEARLGDWRRIPLGMERCGWGCTAPIQAEFARKCRLLAGLYQMLRV